MRTASARALVLAALALWGLSCRQGAQPAANSQPAAGAKATPGADAAAQPPSAPVTHLKPGDPAPDFALTDTNGQTVRLSDFRGKKNVVLAFYVLAFTGG